MLKFLFLLVQIEDMPMFPNILFSRLTFMNFYKNITNKCTTKMSQPNAKELALNKFLLAAS